MAIEIIMPQLGESVAEGTIIRWLMNPGDRIVKDQPIVEISTDKVDVEIPSPASGVLTRVLHHAGETVQVGTVIGTLDEPATGRHVEPSTVETVERGERYSPAVRHLAKEHGVDLSKVMGTGEGGRITRDDVLRYVASRAAPTAPLAPTDAGADRIQPLTVMRKTIAERMVRSKHTSAHVTTVFEADWSSVVAWRERQKETLAREGLTLTFLPFAITATALALKDFPILNSSWEEAGIRLRHEINIGVAVALEDGLLVPVIRRADQQTVPQLARAVADLAERARTKRLLPDEVQGGTFSITNHGVFGSLLSTPIINQPQVAILGIGAIQKRPVVIPASPGEVAGPEAPDAIAIRPMGFLSLTFDHRVIDGATADQFVARIKHYLERLDWKRFF